MANGSHELIFTTRRSSKLASARHSAITMSTELRAAVTMTASHSIPGTVNILGQWALSFSQEVLHSFPSWLVWGRNQVYCACYSARRATASKLVLTGIAKQTACTKSLLSYYICCDPRPIRYLACLCIIHMDIHTQEHVTHSFHHFSVEEFNVTRAAQMQRNQANASISAFCSVRYWSGRHYLLDHILTLIHGRVALLRTVGQTGGQAGRACSAMCSSRVCRCSSIFKMDNLSRALKDEFWEQRPPLRAVGMYLLPTQYLDRLENHVQM